jgi:hypothetical protein
VELLVETKKFIADLHACETVMKRAQGEERKQLSEKYLWTLAFGHHEDRTPTHGYEPTREASMAAFAKSWRRK